MSDPESEKNDHTDNRPSELRSDVANDDQFMTTQWSMVLAAASAPSPSSCERDTALAQLCRRYWVPLYAFLRRKGHSDNNAQDLTQGFFERLLAKDYLKSVAPEKGRFRSFMLTAIKHYASNEHDRNTAQKRGGGVQTFSMDFVAAEEWYRIEPADSATADLLFERRWALSLLENVISALRNKFEQQGRLELFNHLKPHLTSDSERLPYESIAEHFGCSVSSVKSTMHRMKKTYRELVRAEVAQTVKPGDVEEELQHLMNVLSS